MGTADIPKSSKLLSQIAISLSSTYTCGVIHTHRSVVSQERNGAVNAWEPDPCSAGKVCSSCLAWSFAAFGLVADLLLSQLEAPSLNLPRGGVLSID